MALLNVRLSAEEARLAQALRGEGVAISALVRDAIRSEYERRVARKRAGKRPSQRIAEILASLPDPPDLPPVRPFPLTDRHGVRAHMATKVRRSQP